MRRLRRAVLSLVVVSLACVFPAVVAGGAAASPDAQCRLGEAVVERGPAGPRVLSTDVESMVLASGPRAASAVAGVFAGRPPDARGLEPGTGELLLTGHGDQALFAILDHEGLGLSGVGLDGETISVVLPAGIYDVIAMFERACAGDAECGGELGICATTRGVCTGGKRLVVREGIAVGDGASVPASLDVVEAVHDVWVAPRDEVGMPLVGADLWFDLRHRAGGFGLTSYWSTAALVGIIRTSDVSAAYDFDLTAFARRADGRTYFTTDGTTAGIRSELVFSTLPEELTMVTVRHHPAPGDPAPTLALDRFTIDYGFHSTTISRLRPTPALEWPLWVSRAPRASSPFFHGVQVLLPGDLNHVTPDLQGAVGSPGLLGYFPFEAAPVYRAAHAGEVPIGLGPPRFFGRLTGGAAGIPRLGAAVGTTWTPFVLQGGDIPPAPGGVVPTWFDGFVGLSLPQSRDAVVLGEITLAPPPPTPRIVVATPPYFVGGVAGSGTVELGWDPVRTDADPPALAAVRFESDGRLTDTVRVGRPLDVFVTPVDAVDRVAVRVDGNDFAEVGDPPGGFRVTVPDPCDGRTGGVRLELFVRDPAGNYLLARWSPGIVCVSPTCGDGSPDAGEACDDGNRRAGDGCNATCTSDERCGNAVLDAGEACDDGNVAAGDGCDATCGSERACTMPETFCMPRLFCSVANLRTVIACDGEVKPARIRKVARLVNRFTHALNRPGLRASRCRLDGADRAFARPRRILDRLEEAIVRARAMPRRCREAAMRPIVEARLDIDAAVSDFASCVPPTACDPLR